MKWMVVQQFGKEVPQSLATFLAFGELTKFLIKKRVSEVTTETGLLLFDLSATLV